MYNADNTLAPWVAQSRGGLEGMADPNIIRALLGGLGQQPGLGPMGGLGGMMGGYGGVPMAGQQSSQMNQMGTQMGMPMDFAAQSPAANTNPLNPTTASPPPAQAAAPSPSVLGGVAPTLGPASVAPPVPATPPPSPTLGPTNVDPTQAAAVLRGVSDPSGAAAGVPYGAQGDPLGRALFNPVPAQSAYMGF